MWQRITIYTEKEFDPNPELNYELNREEVIISNASLTKGVETGKTNNSINFSQTFKRGMERNSIYVSLGCY